MAVSSSVGGYAKALACFHTSSPVPQRTACLRLPSIKICVSPAASVQSKKTAWVWTEYRQVMTAAVERGWSTFLFGSKELSKDWSSNARIHPLFIDGLEILDEGNKKVAAISVISSPSELQLIQPENMEVQNTVIDFRGDWQVIPAENIVAACQGCAGTVLAVSKNSTEAQVFLEALEQGLDGVVLKVEDMDDIIKLKDYFDRRNEAKSQLQLTKATVSKVEIVGMGDRVCVDFCSIMRPGEGLLVGSYARGMFLVHSECLETSYIANRPFKVNAENSGNGTYSIFLQNAETVALITPDRGSGGRTAIPVTSLKVGDEVLVRKQGGARHTGIEIQEFIVEK